MKRIIVKGFGYSIILLIMLGVCLSPLIAINKQLEENTTSETTDEIPLQQAVGENKVEILEVAKAKTIKKKVVKTKNKPVVKKKTTTKKVSAKKYTKSKVRKVSTPKVSSNAYQNYAHDLVIGTYGWSEYDFQCLVKLWNRESRWSATAHNNSSGAHGIPQAKPGNKMRSEGKDWKTNGYTQIRWGLKYIKGRYGSPAKALRHSDKYHWY